MLGYSSGCVEIPIPRRLYEKLREMRVDVESKVVDALLGELDLNPGEEIHVDLARQFLEKGRKLADRDPVQASEKLYKAAEEAVKALILKHGIGEVVERVRERGRWRAEDFFEAISRFRRIYGDDVKRWWSIAWELHAWGLHEAKATPSYVRERIVDVENLVKLAVGGESTREATSRRR